VALVDTHLQLLVHLDSQDIQDIVRVDSPDIRAHRDLADIPVLKV
jgi:hypothetical protein